MTIIGTNTSGDMAMEDKSLSIVNKNYLKVLL